MKKQTRKELAEKGEIPYGYAYPELDNQDFKLSDKIDELKKEIREKVKVQYEKDSGIGRGTDINISWEIGESWDLAINLTFQEAQKIFEEFLRRLKEEMEKLVYSGSEIYLPQVELIKEKIDTLAGEELI
ncbi:MAG: hypothetical protein PHD04_03470 [Candidatus Pacebacteria bacterium]|nr:hypothetical protein [Candidatus Paceibacterota bacterium]